MPSSASPSSLFGDDSPPTPSPAGWVTAHCDGGARGNPGPAGYGAVLQDSTGRVLAELSEFLGVRTNNYAEYAGLLACLQWAHDQHQSRLRVVSDSLLMVRQIQGRYKVTSPDLRPLWEQARSRIAQLDEFEITHALRHKNKNADRLANQAMDRGTGRSSEGPRPGGTFKDDPARAAGSSSAAGAGSKEIVSKRTGSRRAGAKAPVTAEPEPSIDPDGGNAIPERRSDNTGWEPVVEGKEGRGEASTPAQTAGRAQASGAFPRSSPPAMLGVTRDGAIYLLGGRSLPDGVFVKVIPE